MKYSYTSFLDSKQKKQVWTPATCFLCCHDKLLCETGNFGGLVQKNQNEKKSTETLAVLETLVTFKNSLQNK